MQQSPVTLTQRLIDAVDDSYHVKDMGAIIEVLETLEQLPVTKELLETTRLGKTINVFRKRINDEKLAKRAKNLVKKWRDAVLVVEQQQSGGRPVNGNSDGLHVPGGGGHLRSNLGGYNSNSSSPQLMSSSNSRLSPNALHNSNSLSPRILNNLTSNNNLSGRNGQQQQVGRSSSAMVGVVSSSPRLLSSSSPSLRVSSPSQFGNKAKSPSCPGPISSSSSPQINNNNNTKMLTSTNSYAPNVELVARTNAANKRLRIEDGAAGSNVGPPSKRARHVIANGGIFEGTLDDPSLALLDDLSKDSMTSRASDNSDGSSSKPVSNMSSAVLSGAPSPASIVLGDSALTSPAASVGEGEIGGETGQDDNKPLFSSSIPENEVSAVDHGANNVNDQPQVAEVVAPVQKRGRKKKQKNNEMDAQTLRIHKQIAQAKQESMVRTVHRLSMEIFDDDHRFAFTPDVPPPPPLERKPTIPKPHLTAALSRDDPVMKSDFVKEYLHSQNKQIERQRNEISLLPIEPTPPPPVIPTPADEPLDSKKKRKRDKKKNRGGDNAANTISFPTESEILSRLPPIDPETLEELKNFKFDAPSEDEEAKSKPEIETENATSLIIINESNTENIKNAAEAPPLIASKIDWGDSEDEDDFVDVSPKIEATSSPPDHLGDAATLQESTTPLPQTDDMMDTQEDTDLLEPEVAPVLPREIDDSEVERLHLEKIGNLNGNLDKNGHFKEWQEVVAVESFKGDLLHILPYTIIDF